MISNTEHRIASRNCLTFGDGTDRAFRNVGKNYHFMLRKIPNENRYQLNNNFTNPLVKPRRRWKDNIKNDLQEMRWESWSG